MTSDALGMALQTTESSDSSLGSAMLAGIAVGVFDSAADAVAKCVKRTGDTIPDMQAHEQYLRVFEEYQRIHDALAPIYDAR